MKPGRKASPTPEAQADELDHAGVVAKGNALTTMSAASMEIAECFGDGTPYDRSRVVSEARFYAGQSAEAMLELGKRLLQIKENEPHGEFLEIVTQRLGIGARSAQLMMQASLKFLAPSLATKAQTLALLGRSKLFDLMAEADGDIEELAEGGSVAGLTLDEMQSMSARELRTALAEARKAAAAKDKVIQSKSAKLDKLEEEAAARRDAPMEEAEAIQLDDLRNTTLEAETALLRMLATVDEVIGMPATAAAEIAARHSLDYLVQRIVDGCMARGITVDLAERVSPIWAAPIDEAATKGAGRKARKA